MNCNSASPARFVKGRSGPPAIERRPGGVRILSEVPGMILMVQEIHEQPAALERTLIPAQLFAAYLAEAKGLDPDAPRHLKKITHTV